MSDFLLLPLLATYKKRYLSLKQNVFGYIYSVGISSSFRDTTTTEECKTILVNTAELDAPHVSIGPSL